MKSKKTIILQFIVFCIVLVFGLYFYFGAFSNYSINSHTTTGIVTSQHPYNPDILKVNSFEMSLNTINNTILLAFDFSYCEQGNYSLALSLPYQIARLVTCDDLANWTYANALSGSVVMASINANEKPIGWNFIRLQALAYCQNQIADTIFESSTINLPFASGYTYDVQEAKEKLGGNRTLTAVGGGWKGYISIVIPPNCFISTSTLPVKRIDSWAGQQVMQFSLDSYAPFTIQYINSDARNIFVRDLLFSGVFIGAAVSLLAGIIVDNADGLTKRFKDPSKLRKGRI